MCDNKIYIYHNGWEELYVLYEDKDSEIREAIKEAEDCPLKQSFYKSSKNMMNENK